MFRLLWSFLIRDFYTEISYRFSFLLSLSGVFFSVITFYFLSELIGAGVNIINGDYSRGAVGFWVENGTIQYPVEEVTVAGNLKDMFRRVAAVGSDVDTRGNIRSGSILLEQVTVAGD